MTEDALQALAYHESLLNEQWEIQAEYNEYLDSLKDEQISDD